MSLTFLGTLKFLNISLAFHSVCYSVSSPSELFEQLYSQELFVTKKICKEVHMCQYAFAQNSVYFHSLFYWVPAVWTLSTFAQGIAILHPSRPGITLFGEENHM